MVNRSATPQPLSCDRCGSVKVSMIEAMHGGGSDIIIVFRCHNGHQWNAVMRAA